MTTIIGCDFTSRPTRSKPITLAVASVKDNLDIPDLKINRLLKIESLNEFEKLLTEGSNFLSAPWVGGFDMPFGLPRELVVALNWPINWLECIKHYTSLERSEIREIFRDFCSKRPVGSKFAHRSTDLIAKSSPSMKWVNPPVAYMLYAGLPVLINAQVTLPGLFKGEKTKVGLEAYPGQLAREIVAHQSYKSDDKSKQNQDRLKAREKIIKALKLGGHSLGIKVTLSKTLERELIDDASGDSLDAVLCAVQAAWGLKQKQLGHKLFGLNPKMDNLEGWIVTC